MALIETLKRAAKPAKNVSDGEGGRKSSGTTGSGPSQQSKAALCQGKIRAGKIRCTAFLVLRFYKGTKAGMVNTNQALPTPFVPVRAGIFATGI